MLVRIWRKCTLVSASFVVYAAFMGEVQDKVKRSGVHSFIEISSRSMAHESREWSPIFLDSAFDELGRRRLTRD